MIKKIYLLAVGLALLASVATAKPKDLDNARGAFQKDFPNSPVTEVRDAPISGLYEIQTGDVIVYYHPKSGHVLFGNIFTKGGEDLTGTRYSEIAKTKLGNIPRDKAIKIGNGKNEIIEITDPDCPFCRKTDEYLKGRDDVTRYVFLIPLKQIHPDSEKKIKYILCQENQGAAYEAVMNGKLDGGKPYKTCTSKAVDEQLKAFLEVGEKLRIQGTPALFVNGRFVNGANIPVIEKLIAEGNKP